MHDRKGNPVKVGDRVNVPCVIAEVQSNDGYCNCRVETEERMYPGNSKTVIVLNTKQVELAGPTSDGVPIAKPETVEEAAKRGFNS